MSQSTPITVAYGDGIGPEIMDATLKILGHAKAAIQVDTIEVGQKVYEKGNTTGIPDSAWELIHRNKILLKAPITTPQGGGYKSLNVTMRRMLGLYANVRPCVAYAPFVATNHPKLDVVVVRENEEDLYTGIEHRQTCNTYQSLKLISRPACERIVHYAFDYAVKNGRKRVSCFSKDNIMKMTDGLFHKVFDEIAKGYPEIETDHYIIDIGTARLASRPDKFDVIVTSNLYGDIISDVVAEVSGSVGLAGSANIGEGYALFEAIHGSAPDIAGKKIANPSGLLHGAIMMLVHIGQPKVAETIHNAWLSTIEDGIHTADIYNDANSKKKVSTDEFADAVIQRLGNTPKTLKAAAYKEVKATDRQVPYPTCRYDDKKQLVGIDVFVDWHDGKPEDLANKVNAVTDGKLKLQLVAAKGLKVWPGTGAAVPVCDHWCLRFVPEGTKISDHAQIIHLLGKLQSAGLDFIKTENLYTFNDQLGFTLAQGQ